MVELPKERSRLRRWLEYDYFPGAERWLRRVVYNPLGSLCLAALAALLCGIYLHPNGFILFAGILSVLLLGILWPWIGLRGLAGRLEFSAKRIKEGESVEVSLIVRNHLPWAAWGLGVRGFGEKPPEGSKDAPPPAASMAIAPGRRTAAVHWQITPLGRGVYPSQPARLCTGFPFGLRESKRLLSVDEALVVWPKTYPVGPAPLSVGENQIEGAVSRNKVGTNGDVIGVRPYRRGDLPRRIHWAQSARHDRLIVCELQSNARPVVQFVLDLDSAIHRGAGVDSSREWAIRVFASLAEGWIGQGVPLEAVIGKQTLPLASGLPHLQRIMDALARIADEPQSTLADVLAAPICSGFRNGVQVVVTTDRALATLSLSHVEHDRRLVVLRADAFAENAVDDAPRPERAWLWLDSAAGIPHQLKHGWKEALHGS
jgi:uncharacterized protein (DUF58 family)